MNPMQVLYTINSMNQVETFNYIRYEMNKSEVRAIVNFYEGKFQSFVDLDTGLLLLNDTLKDNIRIMKEYLQ